MFISHPLVKKDAIQSRLYQEVIVSSASKANTLVVAPTALGKTVIAVLLAAHRLLRYRGSKVLMISTTRPLVSQHARSFRGFLKVDEGEVNVFTGQTPPEKRVELWEKSRVVCATPQVMENDIISARYSLEDVSLIVFDEAHRTTGDYPYSFIAKKYMESATHPLILALTASPGGDEGRIKEVCKNLYIENIEVRTEADPDVRPYVRDTEIEWVKVDLPEEFLRIKTLLESAARERLENLKHLGLVRSASPDISKKDLLKLRGALQKEIAEEGGAGELYTGLSHVAAVINLTHAVELLETQGLETLDAYFGRLKKQGSKAAKGLIKDPKVRGAMEMTAELASSLHHPKLEALVELIKKAPKDGRVMVFTQYRDSARKIVEALEDVPGARPVRFVGQASREKDKGLTQKQQLDILDRFRAGEFNILVATSVAEEGLDIPKVDLVVFYEPIPSEIRAIQRRGRTGRHATGRVVVLMAKKTRDEGFYWSSFHKERRMRKVLEGLKEGRPAPRLDLKQKEIRDFYRDSIEVIVDSRELASSVVRELLDLGVISKPKKLDVADYILSDRVGVERKTAADFVSSIMDKRLMEQAMALKRSFSRPLLIIEGGDIYSVRNVHPNAIRGALASLLVDYGLPLVFTNDEKETAQLLAAIARREREEGREVQIRGEKFAPSLREQQEFIVAGLPKVNTVIARRLLEEFGTVEGVFTAEEEELQKVEKIGKKIAEEIRKVLTSRYGD
ncbi:MAG: DEAD/DEAH box helicase [Euryarchaeota archaeon]|nr:DEAD/DEAH box helicase [Euryarchaeota archaeon]